MNFLIIAVGWYISWGYTEENVTLYGVTRFELYMGLSSVVAGNPPVHTFVTQWPETRVIVDVEPGTTYYFCTKVFGAGGESPYSGELVWSPPLDPLPTPTATPTPLPTPSPLPAPTPGKWWKK